MTGNAYSNKVYKIFPALKSLDGYRKLAPMKFNIRESQPVEQDAGFEYNTENTDWYNFEALNDPYPGQKAFDDSSIAKREEAQFKTVLNDCKNLLDRKTNILLY